MHALNPSDQQLWISLKSGDHQALERIYKLYSSKLYNYGSKFATDKELIKDGIQELFVTLWERRKYLGHPAELKNYLFKAFRLNLFKKLKALKNQESYVDAEDYPFYVSLSMEQIIIDGEQTETIKMRLEATLSQLTARQREAIFLKFYENLSYDEIAEVMGLSVKGAYKLMARALDLLRNKLDKNDLIIILFLLRIKLYH